MNALLAKTATQTDQQIVSHMLNIEAVIPAGPQQRMVWAALVDTLTARHPELGNQIDDIYESDISNTDLRPAIIVAAGEYVAA